MMKNTATLAESMLATAKALLPLIVPGSGPAIAAAERAIEMIDHAKDAFDGKTDLAELNATRDELEKRVNAQVKDTADRLRG